jgi:flagellar hook-associated protein 3 FlgL
MRITDNMQLNDALASQASASSQMYGLTAEASSGLKINQPSDDPAGYATVSSLNAQISTLQARSSAVTAVAGDLNLANGALSSAAALLVQAQQIAVEASDGSQSASTRANSATQVNQIAQQMIGLANTQGANGYLFGGTNTSTPPFDANGNFSGNAGVTQVEIANGVTVQSNASGADAFTAAGGRNVIADLQNLATALSSNDVATIQSSVGNLTADNSQVVDAQVNVGVSAGTLQSSSEVMATALTTAQTSLANEQDADAPTVYSELTQVQTSYESAISVNRQILSMFQTEQQQLG